MRIRERINNKKKEGERGGRGMVENTNLVKQFKGDNSFPVSNYPKNNCLRFALFSRAVHLGRCLIRYLDTKDAMFAHQTTSSTPASLCLEENILRRRCAFVHLVWREIYIGCDCRKRKNWDWEFAPEMLPERETKDFPIKQETLTQETRWSVFKNCES